MPKAPAMVVDLDDGERGRAIPTKDWWDCGEAEAGPALAATARAIQADQMDREQQMLRLATLHENELLGSLYDLALPRKDKRTGPWNGCKAMTHTAKSMICRSPVKTRIDTSSTFGGVQRLAREATRWLYGVFDENKVATNVMPDAYQDAGTLNLGAVVPRVIKGRIVIQRWFPWEVFVSDDEALYGDPSALQLMRWMPKHRLLEELGIDRKGKLSKEDKAIVVAVDQCQEHNEYFEGTRLQKSIPVFFGWKKNGKQCISLTGKTLYFDDWKEDFIPIVWVWVERPMAGIWGEGFVQAGMGYQCEIYALNDAIDEHWRLMSSRKVLFEMGCGIDEDEWDNEIGSTHWINQGSREPILWGPDSVPGELLQERADTWQQMLREQGFNDWSIAAQEPAQRSGKGMEIARDKERGRLLTSGNQYEQAHVELGDMCLRLGKYTSGKVFGRIPSEKELKPVDFKEISELITKYPWRVRKTPVSALPDSPDERAKKVERWVEIGLVTAQVGQSLLELNDVDYQSDLFSAMREETMALIENILIKGREGYEPPDPVSDLENGRKMMAAARAKAKRNDVEQEKLDLMQDWIDEAKLLMQPPEAPTPELRAGVGNQPQAAPLPNRMPAPGAGPVILGPDGQPAAGAPPAAEALPPAVT